jgi:hypothetical protein
MKFGVVKEASRISYHTFYFSIAMKLDAVVYAADRKKSIRASSHLKNKNVFVNLVFLVFNRMEDSLGSSRLWERSPAIDLNQFQSKGWLPFFLNCFPFSF